MLGRTPKRIRGLIVKGDTNPGTNNRENELRISFYGS